MFKTLHVNNPEFTDETWQNYFNLLKTLSDRKQGSLSSRNATELKERLLTYLNTWPDNSRFVIFEDNNPVGWCEVRVMDHESEDVAVGISIDLLFSEIPPECAKVVAVELIKILKNCGSSHALCMATNPCSSAIVKAIGGHTTNRIDAYRLYRSKAQIELINKWLENYPREFPDLKIEFYDGMPEEYIEEYSRTFKQFVDEMPSEHDSPLPFHFGPDRVRKMKKYREKLGSHLYTFVLFDSSGRMIGHTNGFINEKTPKSMYQAMTGILKEYRGRGLSKWLKAALFKKIGEDFPDNEYCVTELRAVNKPIETVNKQMGYELVSRGHEYDITLEALQAVIDRERS